MPAQKRKPTIKQQKAIQNIVENGGNVSKGMRDAGYSEATAKTPQKLTESIAWQELMEKHLPDETLAKVHGQLLKSTGIGHMVFPNATKDEEIIALLQTVNCTVRKIQRGDQAVHVWFWAPDNRARKDGLEMAYKLKGHYAPEKKKIDIDDDLKEALGKINKLLPD